MKSIETGLSGKGKNGPGILELKAKQEDGTMEEKQMTGNQDFNVDEALDRLEEINQRLAAKDITLKESLELYKEGTKLAAACQERLVGVEKELQIIEE